MEDDNKEQYFKYYQTKPPTSDSCGRKKLQFKKYNNGKILPHITQEYNYRITNYLLIKKIISPKRDKTIMQSLEGMSRKYHSAHVHNQSVSRDKCRVKGKLKTYDNIRSDYTGSYENCMKEQPRAKTALKEARIPRRTLQKKKTEARYLQGSVVTINEVQNDLDQSYKLQDGINFTTLSKESKDDRIVMRNTSYHKKWKENYPLHGFCFKNHSAGYGNGPTILLLTHLQIDTNPAIKPQTLIQLQLIERAAFSRTYFNMTYENDERTVKTDPFKYCELPKENDASSCVKFCIRPLRIGDFVPLRIWKYCGVQSIMVGTIDLPLNAYSQEQNGQANKRVELVQKKDNELMFRKVFHGQVQHNLSKSKMFQTDSIALVKYKVYPKKFNRRQDKIMINN